MLITLGHWRRLARITRLSTGALLAVVLLAASPALAQEDPFTAKDPKPGDKWIVGSITLLSANVRKANRTLPINQLLASR